MSKPYPREIAVRVLTRVLSEGQALDRALDELAPPAVAGAESSRGWLQEVCSGAIRWKGRLDLAIDSTAIKKRPTGWLRKHLLIASYQLIAQDRTSPAAVVSETVEAIRKKEGEPPAKFANALLRRIAEHGDSWRQMELPSPATDEEVAQWASLPEWLWKRIVASHGFAWAKAYALASLDRPTTWLRSVDPAKAPPMAEPGPWQGIWRADAPPDFTSDGFFAQDISNQFLVRAIATRLKEVASSKSPLRSLDLCAAPGGKSLGLALDGFSVWSTDSDPARMILMDQTFERLKPALARGGYALPRSSDKAAATQAAPFDLVWVDAPCTGSGILRRHPDARWLKRESDLENLTQTQAALLDEAWTSVVTGGSSPTRFAPSWPKKAPCAPRVSRKKAARN